MWKKADDAVGAQSPDLQPLGDALIESLIDSRFKKENVTVAAQKALPEDHHQAVPSPTMATYTEAVNEFTRNATAFIEQLPLLTKARNAYEQAMRAGAELRKVLDTGEENLQTLMSQLDQAVNLHGVKPGPDRKKPELARVEAIRGSDEGSAGVKRFP
jgi:hypothetical protein